MKISYKPLWRTRIDKDMSKRQQHMQTRFDVTALVPADDFPNPSEVQNAYSGNM